MQDAHEGEQRPVPQIKRIADETDANHEAVTQQTPVDERPGAGMDQQHRARHRQQRPDAREALVLIQAEDGQQQQCQAECRA